MTWVSLPFVAAVSWVPASAYDPSTNPRAAGRLRLGENPPDVTMPMSLPSCLSNTPSRTGRAPLAKRPTRCRLGPLANSSRMIDAPGKSAASRRFFDSANVRPAVVGVMVSSSSCPHKGSPASSRNVSRAPSPARVTFFVFKKTLGKWGGTLIWD